MQSLADALQQLGATRIEALLVCHLREHHVATTKEIIQATGLRQPEVSVGMRDLRGRGWIDLRPVPREGKGRPMHAYHLAASPAQIGAYYGEHGRRSLHRYEAALAQVADAFQ